MSLSSVTIERPQRWDEPFGPDMAVGDVDSLLSKPPFDRIDGEKFPSTTSLFDILKNDTRIMRYSNGDIVVREGDYGNSAFLILEGDVRVVVDPIDDAILGRQETRQKTFFEALSQLWANSKIPEVRDPAKYKKIRGTKQRGEGKETRIFLQDVPTVLDRHQTVRLEPGSMFGEIAALGRTSRTATVFAAGDCVLLEIRWQGLREIRRWSDDLRNYIDNLYRERSLKVHLQETPEFSHLTEEELSIVAENTLFETYGNFDWHATYKSLAERNLAERLEEEPIIAKEGNYADGLIMIRAGFARLTERVDHGHRTISYLGRGTTFGFIEIAQYWRFNEMIPLQRTLRALGYVDVLRVPASIIERFVLPSMPEKFLPPKIVPRGEAQSAWKEKSKDKEIDIGLMEFLVDNRFINGTASMLINLDRCTRCDDCVRACAEAHDNNPRFIRHGKRFNNYMVANACMHCSDPVCMIGCPTGAIHRESYMGQVVINDVTCIGCATCANSCPYDNIRMVPIRNNKGAFILDQNTNMPIEKATKCDLCIDQLGGPACQRACPHDALRRIDMRDEDKLIEWINK